MGYHHGSLRQALLAEGELLLARGGVSTVTLRAVARAAGVSHAAPRNHFGSLAGLLSALAAEGFARLIEAASPTLAIHDANERMHRFGRCYVRFAIDHPGLFSLMFRDEVLDNSLPDLRSARAELLDLLGKASGTSAPDSVTPEAAKHMALAWAQVHGFASLFLDGRLEALIGRVSGGMNAAEFLAVVLES